MTQPLPPPPDRTLVNTRPVHAGSTVYIAPSPTLATYPAWMLRRHRPRRATR